ILADYHLDLNRTGLDAIEAIRQHAARAIPAAIITADRSDDIRRLIRARSLPLLNKPVKPNRLRALLGSLHGET
ncbi:MAG: hybrid sensor histidine kinase/response regulator, partial [Marinobacter sp.]